jgi:hypothetical protein
MSASASELRKRLAPGSARRGCTPPEREVVAESCCCVPAPRSCRLGSETAWRSPWQANRATPSLPKLVDCLWDLFACLFFPV